MLQCFLVNGCSDVGFQKTQWTNTSRWHCTPNHHRLWKLNTGLQATWAISFSTFPPDSRTLVPNQIQNLLCSQIPWHVCVWCSWCLDPSLSPFLVKFTKIIESILLDNPHKAVVLSIGCASFSSTLFPSTQLYVNMLRYSTLWTASFFDNECLWLTLLEKGVNDFLLETVRSAVFPMIV